MKYRFYKLQLSVNLQKIIIPITTIMTICGDEKSDIISMGSRRAKSCTIDFWKIRIEKIICRKKIFNIEFIVNEN